MLQAVSTSKLKFRKVVTTTYEMQGFLPVCLWECGLVYVVHVCMTNSVPVCECVSECGECVCGPRLSWRRRTPTSQHLRA